MCQYPNSCTRPIHTLCLGWVCRWYLPLIRHYYSPFAVFATYSPLSHYLWCILFNPPCPPPPQKKRKEKKKTICIRITHHFHKDHNAPCLPPKSGITIVFDFSWDEGNTRRNWKQSLYIMHLFIYFILSFFVGGGGEYTGCIMVYVQMENYSKNDSYAFFGGEGRVKRGGFMHEQCESGE